MYNVSGTALSTMVSAVVNMETTKPRGVFNGTVVIYVEAFTFTYENVIMCGKEREDEAACLFPYLGGEALKYLSKRPER